MRNVLNGILKRSWFYFILASSFWIVFQILVQEGRDQFLSYLVQPVYWILPFLLIFGLLANAFILPDIAIPIIAYLVWAYFATPLSILRDGLIFFFFVGLISHWLGNKFTNIKPQLLAIVITIVMWIALSLGDILGGIWDQRYTISLDKSRYDELREKSTWKEKRIGLALSGGGYRAALLHAGVLDALERMGVAPTHISSVSGGSIIGSYYAIGGRPELFLNAVQNHRFKLAREATNFVNVAHMLLCPLWLPGTKTKLNPKCEFGRVDVQANLLDRVLLGEVKVKNLAGKFPKLLVCATEIEEGMAIGIASDGLAYISAPSIQSRFQFANTLPSAFLPAFKSLPEGDLNASVKLSKIVAASGAFPGAFNSVKLPYGSNWRYVMDGGLTDNSGINLLLTASQGSKEWNLDILIASDGGMPFSKTFEVNQTRNLLRERKMESVLQQLNRALDIVYNGTGKAQGLDLTLEPRRLLLSPSIYLNADALTPNKEMIQSDWNKEQKLAQTDQALSFLMNESWTEEFEASLIKEKGHSDSIKYAHEGPLGSLKRSLETFVNAATLKDNFEEDEARRIFHLGRMLVVLNWRHIRDELVGSEQQANPNEE